MASASAPAEQLNPFWPEQRRALAAPEKGTVSEWADRHRVLDRLASATPGPWTTDRTPYLREIQDAFSDPTVEQIVVKKATQVGATEAMLNCFGWLVCNQPRPALIVYPTETVCKRVSRIRLKPMFRASPELRLRLKGETASLTNLEYTFENMVAVFSWANSPAMLSSMPICYLFLDEVDKYPPASSREADPLSLATERTRTFRRLRKIVLASSPTTADGAISRAFEQTDQRRWEVPCPHCEKPQILQRAQLRWPEARTIDEIEDEKLAWYECEFCGGRIGEEEKAAVIRRGEWRATAPGRVSHRGYSINCLMSPFLTWSEIVAEWLRSQDDREKLQNFINSWLAEEWEDRIAVIDDAALAARVSAARRERGALPDECQLLTWGADVHGERKGLYWSAWAWGHGRRCWLVDYGLVYTWADLNQSIYGREWTTPDGLSFLPFGGVDMGYSAPEVYRFTGGLFPHARATQGKDWLDGAPVKDFPIDYTDKHTGQTLRGQSGLRISTGFYKDLLQALLGDPEDERLDFCRGVEKTFLEQLVAEHKVRGRGGKPEWRQFAGRPNHWLDTFVIAAAVAERFGLMRLKPLPEASDNDRIQTAAPAQRRPQVSDRGAHAGFRRHW